MDKRYALLAALASVLLLAAALSGSGEDVPYSGGEVIEAPECPVMLFVLALLLPLIVYAPRAFCRG